LQRSASIAKLPYRRKDLPARPWASADASSWSGVVDLLLKFAPRAKSKIYHAPGGDHPSMIAHPEVTVAAIRDAASSISR
jgi:hypothetical protein